MHDVQCTATLDARGLVRVQEYDRHANTHLGAAGYAQEVDMDWTVADRIELHIARKHAVLLAADLDIEQMRQETFDLELTAQKFGFQRDGNGGLFVAID